MTTRPALLAIDVGNTRLKWALYAGDAPALTLAAPALGDEAPASGTARAAPSEVADRQALAQGVVFLEHIDTLADVAWAPMAAAHGAPLRVLGCCVAGDSIRRRVEEQLELWDTPVNWVIASSAECGLGNGYDHPARLGADRWVAMIGARDHMQRRLREPRYVQQGIGPRPLVVVMVGTAVTVEAIDQLGQFLGGLILPGHGIMLKSLQAGTSGLHVPTGEVQDFPTNTSDALTSGGTYAIAGAIERMYSSLQHRCGIKPWCYMTGGAGWKMQPHIPVPFELLENLIFEGLLRVATERGLVGGA